MRFHFSLACVFTLCLLAACTESYSPEPTLNGDAIAPSNQLEMIQALRGEWIWYQTSYKTEESFGGKVIRKDSVAIDKQEIVQFEVWSPNGQQDLIFRNHVHPSIRIDVFNSLPQNFIVFRTVISKPSISLQCRFESGIRWSVQYGEYTYSHDTTRSAVLEGYAIKR